MILKRLQARGFMRYRSIDLSDLPDRGVVAILGDNESGKSTLGECVSFALFGETVKSRATELSQIVSWDAEEAHVEAEVELEGARLVVTRRVDKQGRAGASLREAGGAVLAEGAEGVGRVLRERFGMGFDEFRASFYLAQQEIDILRRGDAGEGRRTVEAIVGVTTLDRAAGATREAITDLQIQHRALANELSVAETLVREHTLPEGAGDELEAEAARYASRREATAESLPALRRCSAGTREAVSGRAAAGDAFSELQRALIAGAAEARLQRVGAELAEVGRGLQAEIPARHADLEVERQRADEIGERIDRLIDYRTRMAQLEARLEIYRNEVRRSLEAPAVEDADLAQLGDLALPSTPAASTRLAALRVGRIRRARNRSAWRFVIFLVLGLVFGAIGLPAIYHLLSRQQGFARRIPAAEVIADAEALSGLDRLARLYERGLNGVGLDPSRPHAWQAMFGAGFLGLGLGLLLSALSLSQVMSRNDELKLATEANERLEAEVEALRAEQSSLEDLTLKRPLEFAEKVKVLRNPRLREEFEAVREVHNDFLSEKVQGAELVRVEREQEVNSRSAVGALEDRLARLGRLYRSLPPTGSGFLPDEGEEGVIPEALEPVEERVELLLERFERSHRDWRDATRGGPPGNARQLFDRLQAGAAAAQFPGADEEADGEGGEAAALDLSPIQALVEEASDLAPEEVAASLKVARETLESALPGTAELIERREEAERKEQACTEVMASATGKLEALGERLAEVRARRDGDRQRRDRVRLLRERIEPIARDIEVHVLCADLLTEARDDLRSRVGPMLAEFAAAVLPRLTGGRYRKVRVSAELDIKVYSPDKNDYVPIVDLSMGAADQLLLALRLGMGLALVRSRGLGGARHFLFLDEPLASFDVGRSHAFLEILGELGAVFPQVFLIAHHPLEGLEEEFARVIRTDIANRDLIATDAGVDPPVATGAP